MPLIRVKDKAQITLPVKVRRALNIHEGDYLEVSVEGEKVVLRPQTVLDRVPEVTLSAAGEQALDEGLEDVRAGRVKAHGSMDELLAELADADPAH
jgi:AbrB family looped-hinge helix DNA binding protein